LLQTGDWVECRAKRAVKKSKANKPVSPTTVVPEQKSNTTAGVEPSFDTTSKSLPLEPPRNRAPLLRAKPWRTVEPLTTVDPEDTPISIDLTGGKDVQTKPTKTSPVESVNVVKTRNSKNQQVDAPIKIGREKATVEKPPVINLAPLPAATPTETKSWSQRLADANADRKVLTRFLAFCLFLIAIVNVIPALNHFQTWWGMGESMPLPRWIYLQFFAGCIFLLYSVFLLQVQDWSALRGVSIAMLVLAFLFGAASTALLVADDGWIAGVLEIPYALSRTASMWCVIVVCLTTLISIWAGKESINWQRAERMLHEIMENSQR
jgi:hypothetical protein